MKALYNGVNFDDARFIDGPDRGSLTVVFLEGEVVNTLYVQSEKIAVLRRIFQQCAANDAVSYCALN